MSQALNLSSACLHCGLSFFKNGSQEFCCAGCEFVYGVIQSEGLGHYYEIREMSPPICPIPAQTSTSTYEYCDDPEFVQRLSPDGIKMRFFLEGLNCTACLWLLEKLPDFCRDAYSSRVDMAASTIEVHRVADGSFAAIARTLNRLGYRPHPLRETEASSRLQKRELRRDLVRIGIAGAATGNIMILAVSLYGGATGVLAEQFRYLSALLAVPVLTYCAWPFYQSALGAVHARRMNIDVPIVVAILAGMITSIWALTSNSGITYFDSLSMLVFLLLSSRFVLKNIQRRQLRSTNLENELLLTTTQRINKDGSIEKTSSLHLVPGDRIKIVGETTIPVDGIIESGSGLINRSVMTGESELFQTSMGSILEAGCLNVAGDFVLRVTHSPADTRLAKILRDTEKSANSKSSFVHFSDQISNWFMGIVIGSAVILVASFINSDPHEGISRALALIIVTCPCVFGIAIPLSMSFAIRGAAQNGIVVKNADAIERLWKIKILFFDKTGTLTKGQMWVLNLKTESTVSYSRVLQLAAGLEANQIHPIARAITQFAVSQNIIPQKFDQVVSIVEGGVEGQLGSEHYSIRPIHQPGIAAQTKKLESAYGLFLDAKLVGQFTLGDEVKHDAPAFLKWAKSKHFDSRILSGDRPKVVENCAHILEIEQGKFLANMTPEKKAATMRNTPYSLMVGDGANDAPALAAAQVGIAVCGSLDMSLRAADIYLVRHDLNSIADLFEIVWRTRSAIYRNLVFSVSFNIFSGTLAVLGYMNPLSAAILMPLSSLTVLLSAVYTGNKFGKSIK